MLYQCIYTAGVAVREPIQGSLRQHNCL